MASPRKARVMNMKRKPQPHQAKPPRLEVPTCSWWVEKTREELHDALVTREASRMAQGLALGARSPRKRW